MARARWASRTVFLLAAVGSAVGLGNVWRFPYLTYKYGGGAFLIPYLIALVLVGVPLLMLEFAVGQRMQQSAVKAFRSLHHRFGGLGIFALASSFIITTYYAVVMAWSLIYFIASFGVRWAGDSEGFFLNTVLQLSAGPEVLGGINWLVLAALIAVWVMIYFCVWKGVLSVGRVVYWTVPLPIILLAVLLVRALFLEGFLTGWVFYLRPVWSALLDPQVWQAAFAQIFFTLTLGFGVMVAYASYKKQDADVAKDSWITALVNSGVSLFAGFVVFAVLGYMATSTGAPMAEVAEASGPGLAFVVFPEALSLFGGLSWLFSALFFIVLLTLGIDSAFSLVEAINSALHDRFPKLSLPRISLIVCTIGFLCGLIYTTRAGLYFLDIIDHFVNAYNLILIGLLQAILVGWIYGAERMRTYINEVSDWKIGRWWNVSIKYVVPLVLGIILVWNTIIEVTTPYEGYASWALAIGWAVFFVPLAVFVLMFVFAKRRRLSA